MISTTQQNDTLNAYYNSKFNGNVDISNASLYMLLSKLLNTPASSTVKNFFHYNQKLLADINRVLLEVKNTGRRAPFFQTVPALVCRYVGSSYKSNILTKIGNNTNIILKLSSASNTEVLDEIVNIIKNSIAAVKNTTTNDIDTDFVDTYTKYLGIFISLAQKSAGNPVKNPVPPSSSAKLLVKKPTIGNVEGDKLVPYTIKKSPTLENISPDRYQIRPCLIEGNIQQANVEFDSNGSSIGVREISYFDGCITKVFTNEPESSFLQIVIKHEGVFSNVHYTRDTTIDDFFECIKYFIGGKWVNVYSLKISH
jgi:hypothetical protein